MLKLNKKFTDAASGLLIQPLSYERILETIPDAYLALQNLLIDCNKKFDDFSFVPVDKKDQESARKKAIRDYGGEKRCVTDYVRSKVEVESPETIEQLTGPEFEELLKEHGIEIAAINNYFEEPKDQTGYRCVNMKLAVPVNKERTEFQIVELQIVAKQIEAVYDETHDYKDRAEAAEYEIARLLSERTVGGILMSDLQLRAQSGETLTDDEKNALDRFNDKIAFTKELLNMDIEDAEHKISYLDETKCAPSGEIMASLIERSYEDFDSLTDEEKQVVDNFEEDLAFYRSMIVLPEDEAAAKLQKVEQTSKFGALTMGELREMDLNGETLSPEQENALATFAIEIKPLKTISRLNFAACRLINARAARGNEMQHDLQELLGDEHKGKHMLTPGKEEHMDTMRYKADMLAQQNME